MSIALGIDVAEARKGLDLVAVDYRLLPIWFKGGAKLNDVGAAIDELAPSLVAIDSPPCWAPHGRRRQIELELRALGIQAQWTPAAEFRADHHAWMEVGFQVFELALEKGYPLFLGEGNPEHRAIEVFPHATGVCIRGSVPSRQLPKRIWRREVLRTLGVDDSVLKTLDQVDACLAAITGMRALQGSSSCVGKVGESVLVLPLAQLPAGPFRREGLPLTAPPTDPSPVVDGRSRQCACGCGANVARRYKPGHDAKHKSALIRAARAGSREAEAELKRLGW